MRTKEKERAERVAKQKASELFLFLYIKKISSSIEHQKLAIN